MRARQDTAMAVSHSAYLAAYDQLGSLADAERLAQDPNCPLSFEALTSVLGQKQLVLTKRADGMHRAQAARYVERFLGGENLLSIACTESLPPTKLARFVLEEHLGASKGKEVGQLLKKPTLIADERLRHEVADAVDADPHYGPHVDTAKRLVGLEYEELLAQKLRALGVPFLSEEQLRRRGDARTPDALLPVPLLVRGRVVNWIDSKATFGDPHTHAEYTPQFASYLHRFDAGLVLYWFGFDDSITELDSRVLCLHDLLPAECALMACLPHPVRMLNGGMNSTYCAEGNAQQTRWGQSPPSASRDAGV